MSRTRLVVSIALVCILIATLFFMWGYKHGRSIEFDRRYDEGYLDALEWVAEELLEVQEAHTKWDDILTY